MPPFSSAGYLLLGFTAFVGFLAGLLGFALLRVLSGRLVIPGRANHRRHPILSAGAVGKLPAERSTLACRSSSGSTRRSSKRLTSGLLVASADGRCGYQADGPPHLNGASADAAAVDGLLAPVPPLAALVRDAAAGRGVAGTSRPATPPAVRRISA
jgi:hypothetical protein